MDKAAAETFYAIHKDRPFFADLVSYITSGPVIVMVLQKPDAVKAWRTLMGATNPEKGRIRNHSNCLALIFNTTPSMALILLKMHKKKLPNSSPGCKKINSKTPGASGFTVWFYSIVPSGIAPSCKGFAPAPQQGLLRPLRPSFLQGAKSARPPVAAPQRRPHVRSAMRSGKGF